MSKILEAAARFSLLAPSVFNTQPWHWHLHGDTMELTADESRELAATDPERRLLLVSCGAALQHARVAIAAAGWSVTVDRLPSPRVLARITLGTQVPPDPEAQMMAGAAPRRRTDRRAYDDRAVGADELTRLRRFVESEGAYLHVVRPDQVPMLAVTTDRAANAELGDPAYRAELREWTSRPSWAGDGVPPATAVQAAPRRVPVRDFAPERTGGLAPGAGHDTGAAYVVVFGLTDEPADLLRGGEALSALLLKATADGLATEPISDAVEVSWTRQLMRSLLSGLGEPYVAVRLGYLHGAEPLPATPRRDPAEVITIGS